MPSEDPVEETLSRLRREAAALQSRGAPATPGIPPPTMPSATGANPLTMSDPEFMRSLAQLKDEHLSNLRVIERMYNEQQALGSSGGGYPEAALPVAPRPGPSASLYAGRPDFARPLTADEPPPPPPPAYEEVDEPRAAAPRPRPASAPRQRPPPGRLAGGATASQRAAVDMQRAEAAAAAAAGLPPGLAGSSSADHLDALRLEAERDRRAEYAPAPAAAGSRRARPRSAPPQRPRGITVPRPFSFDARPERKSSSMRRLEAELAEREAQLREDKAAMKHVPLPPSTKEARYEAIRDEAAAKQRARLEGRKEELKQLAKPFSFSERQPKVKPTVEEPKPKQFRAKKVPRAVFEPKWEMMQHEEAGRQERISLEAQRLSQLSHLPPQMEESKSKNKSRRETEMARIKAEADKDMTFRPKVAATLPDFDALQRRFKRSLDEAASARRQRQTDIEPFHLHTDQLRGNLHPAPDQLAMVRRDMERDELVLPEQRWPFVSTRAKASGRNEKPDFDKLWASANCPSYRTTTSAELRKACVEEDRLKLELKKQRAEQEEAKRLEAIKTISTQVAKQLGGGSKAVRVAQQREQRLRRREEFKQDAKEKQEQADARLAAIKEKVASRPFLFQSVSADVQAARAKQEAQDKFEQRIRGEGLGHLLEVGAGASA